MSDAHRSMESQLRFRKKPIVVEAVQYEGAGNFAGNNVPDWLWDAFANNEAVNRNGRLIIKTLEGDLLVCEDDWIIRGVRGELYPCKPDIFEASYEPVPADSAPGGTP